jgi:hypothetical protein
MSRWGPVHSNIRQHLFLGMRPACTAGWLKDYHHLEPTVLKVIVGTLLLVLHNPDVGNQDGTGHRPFFCVIAREDQGQKQDQIQVKSGRRWILASAGIVVGLLRQ